MSKDSQRLQRRRTRLWNEDPICPDCGVKTILPEEIQKQYGLNLADWRPRRGQKKVPRHVRERMATIEHLRSRLNPGRRSPQREGEDRTILLCSKCNQDRNTKETEALGLPELHRRASLHKHHVPA